MDLSKTIQTKDGNIKSLDAQVKLQAKLIEEMSDELDYTSVLKVVVLSSIYMHICFTKYFI